MRKKKKEKITKIKSTVADSPAYAAIMEKYNLLGRSLSISAFWRDYVSTMDPGITRRMWDYYISRLRKNITIKAGEIENKIIDSQATEQSMESNSMRKILAIAELTLDKVISEPELLESIPLEQRVQWLFNAMKARDSRMVATAKLAQEKRKTSMYEDMLQGAQYGAIEEEEVEVVQNNNLIKNTVPTGAKNAIPADIVEFNPHELENKQYAAKSA